MGRMADYADDYKDMQAQREREEAKKKEAEQKTLEETPHFKQCRALQEQVGRTHVRNFNGTIGDLPFLVSFIKRGPKSITSEHIQKVRNLLGLPPDSK